MKYWKFDEYNIGSAPRVTIIYTIPSDPLRFSLIYRYAQLGKASRSCRDRSQPFIPFLLIVAASLWSGCSVTSHRSIMRTAELTKQAMRAMIAPPCSPDAASPWSTWPLGNTTRQRRDGLNFRQNMPIRLNLSTTGPGITWNNTFARKKYLRNGSAKKNSVRLTKVMLFLSISTSYRVSFI